MASIEERFDQFLFGGQDAHDDLAPDTRPAVRLRIHLERTRRGDPTMPFEVAFVFGLKRAMRGLSSIKERDWRDALTGTKEAWRDGYEGRKLARRRL